MIFEILPLSRILLINALIITFNWYHCPSILLVNGFNVYGGIACTRSMTRKKINHNNKVNQRIMKQSGIINSRLVKDSICYSSTAAKSVPKENILIENMSNSHRTMSSDDFDKDDLFLQQLRTRHVPLLFYHDLPIPSMKTTNDDNNHVDIIRSYNDGCVTNNNDNEFLFPPFRKHYPNNPMRLYNPTYAMIVSYHGPSFLGGYEYNPNLPSHQKSIRGELSNTLGNILRNYFLLEEESNDKKYLKLTSLATAGRTDASVSAKATLMTFTLPVKRFSLLNSLQCQEIINKFNQYRQQGQKSKMIHIHSMTPVSAKFHATFDTKSREYIYLWPVLLQSNDEDGELRTTENKDILLAKIMHTLMKPVINQTIDYFSMSQGKLRSQNTDCTLYNAECWLYSTSTISSVDDSFKDKTKTFSTHTQVLYQPSLDERNLSCEAFESCYTDVVPEFGKCWNDMIQRELQLLVNNEDINTAEIENSQKNYGCYVWKVHGNRFLRRMMRKIISTVWQDAKDILQEMTSNMTTPKAPFSDAISDYDSMRWLNRIHNNTQNRSHGIKAAPPEGLCLWSIGIDSTNENRSN